MRNPNGYGTVYKLSGNRRRPWIAKVPNGFGRTNSGKAKQLYKIVGYYETQQAALIALAEYNNGGVPVYADITLNDVYQMWSPSHYETISRKTKLGYEGAYKKLEPLYNVHFRDLKTLHYERLLKDVPYSVAKMAKITLNLMYQYALKNDIIDKNYAKLITLSKPQSKTREIFSDSEIAKLWQNVEREYVDTILILIYTGFRIGELLVLSKFNVDLSNGIITGGLKTEAGKNRTVPINHKILPLVKARYDNADESGRLFSISYRQYYERFKMVLSQLGITGKTPHSTRHTFATLMARNGANIKALQEIIGHADYATTANIYTHLNDDDLKAAIEKI